MAASKTKLARALSAEELDALCVRLAGEKNLTGKRLQEIAKDLGVEIGHDSAATFINKEFEPYLARLEKRKAVAQFIAAKSSPEDVTTIADAAAGELSQLCFELMMASETAIDLTTPEGRKAANQLSLIIARIRSGDHRLRELESNLEEARAEKEKLEAEKKAAEAVLNNPKSGFTGNAVAALRQALGMKEAKQ